MDEKLQIIIGHYLDEKTFLEKELAEMLDVYYYPDPGYLMAKVYSRALARVNEKISALKRTDFELPIHLYLKERNIAFSKHRLEKEESAEIKAFYPEKILPEELELKQKQLLQKLFLKYSGVE